MKTKLRKGDPPVKCFLPAGRSGSFIYAIVLVDHPGVVKIGRTVRWNQRRHAYANWNLRDGDGIAEERVFRINEEYVDLAALETEILNRAPWRRRHKLEWFVAELDDVCHLIDQVMCEGGITYDMMENTAEATLDTKVRFNIVGGRIKFKD